MMRVGLHMLVAVLVAVSFTGTSFSQVRCAMPNGVLITQQLGNCPRDAVQVPAADGGSTTPKQPDQSDRAATQPKPPQSSTGKAEKPPEKPSAGGGGFSLMIWMIMLGGVAALFFAIKGSIGVSGKPLYCTTCGFEGPGKTVTRGSILIEIILWLCFFVPGLIYSIWRHGSKHKACPSCGSTALVPPASPVAVSSKRRLAS